MTIYQEKLQALEQRTIDFSVMTVKVCGVYANEIPLRSMVDQVIRSATSIGANYAEANNASSRTDFRSKIFISKKEAAETRYWLKVLFALTADEKLKPLQQEALELNLIFQKIITSIKNEMTSSLANKK